MRSIKCACGKVLARYENGVIYLWCKKCKREIPLRLDSLCGTQAVFTFVEKC